MSELILHVGLHKTGTSAIQWVLNENREALKNLGFLYPVTGQFDAHHAIAARVKSPKNEAFAVDDVQRTFLSWRSNGYPKVVVSSEMFSECHSVVPLSSIRSLFERVCLVFYVRRQDLLLESAYGQLVKQNGETQKIAECNPYFTDFYSHIRKFTDVMHPDEVIVRKYERSALAFGDAAKDFLVNVLGVVDIDDFVFPSVVNESLSLVGGELVRVMNKYKVENRSEMIREVVRTCNEIGGEYSKPIIGNLLSLNEREKILAESSESNQKLLDAFNVRFDPLSRVVSGRQLERIELSQMACELAAKLLAGKYF
ncbi:hypothetical protein [Microbulbifer guangxiensis]|uniref:hypothetical protein n=1 Tax=Microbulbifer guangxiensis TaxID=2904249 RepID=UPI001F1DF25A|nr:hypothetical protein [Microbulbifer guangxiensis]